MLHLIASARGLPPSAQQHQDSPAHRAAWLAASALGLGFCFFFAWLAPYFNIVRRRPPLCAQRPLLAQGWGVWECS